MLWPEPFSIILIGYNRRCVHVQMSCARFKNKLSVSFSDRGSESPARVSIGLVRFWRTETFDVHARGGSPIVYGAITENINRTR